MKLERLVTMFMEMYKADQTVKVIADIDFTASVNRKPISQADALKRTRSARFERADEWNDEKHFEKIRAYYTPIATITIGSYRYEIYPDGEYYKVNEAGFWTFYHAIKLNTNRSNGNIALTTNDIMTIGHIY